MMITVLLAALTVSFDCGETCGLKVVKSANVRFVEGVKGQAAYFPKDGWLEYQLPSNAVAEAEGTIRVWFRLDRTVKGNFSWMDRQIAPDGHWDRRCLNPDFRNLVDFGRFTRMSVGPNVHPNLCGYGYAVGWNGEVHGGEWHQVGMTWKKGEYVESYFDGLPLGKLRWHEKLCVAPMNGDRLRIGCGINWGSELTDALEGCVDELVVLDRASTDAEFAADYATVYAERVELLDWAVDVGKPAALRFRARNHQTGALREWTETVVADKPGLFTYERNKGKKDYRAYELMALEKVEKWNGGEVERWRGGEVERWRGGEVERWRSGEVEKWNGGGVEKGKVAEYDCTKEYPYDPFFDCGSHVVTNGTLVYREADVNQTSVGFGYRFSGIRHPKKPHVLVVEYPDDAKREYGICIFPEGHQRLFCITVDGAGVQTGVDTPLSGTMQRKETLFWPDNESFTVLMLGYQNFQGSRPAAAARVALYEVGDEAVRGGAQGGDALPTESRGERRSVGTWNEDPGMDGMIEFNHVSNYTYADLDFWKAKWEHVIAYARMHGYNSWTIKTANYRTDTTFMKATLGSAERGIGDWGRCQGWDALGAKMLTDAGLDLWASFVMRAHETDPWLAKLGGRENFDGLKLLSRYGTPNKLPRRPELGFLLKPYREEVKTAVKRLLRASRDRYKTYPGFKGVSMLPWPVATFYILEYGYDDETVARFSSETGVAVPADTPEKRFAFLTAPTLRKTWLDWRCRTIAAVLREYVAALRDDGGDWKLQYWVMERSMREGLERWPDYDLKASLANAGIDLEMLASVDGLDVTPCLHPNYYRTLDLLDTNYQYFDFANETTGLFSRSGVTSLNVWEQSVYEVYFNPPRNMWKGRFHYPAGVSDYNSADFRWYITPHQRSQFSVETFARALAETDVQDLYHGWWGGVDAGEIGSFSRFFKAFASIPRGKFRLLDGYVNDPVAIRVSTEGKGWYAVNRLPWSVKAGSLALGPNEVRCFSKERPPTPDDLVVTLDDEAKEYFRTQRATLAAALKLNPSNGLLREVVNRIETAAAAGRWSDVRALLVTGVARSAREVSPMTRTLDWDYDRNVLSLTFGNFGQGALRGTIIVGTRWADGPAPRFVPEVAAQALDVPPGKEVTLTFPFRTTTAQKALTGRDIVRVTLKTESSERTTEYTLPRTDFTKPVALTSPKSPLKATCTAVGRADGSGIDVTVDAEDPTYVAPTDRMMMHAGDSVELYFDQRCNAPMAPGVTYDADDICFKVGLIDGKPVVFGAQPMGASTEGVVATVLRDESRKHTVYRVFVPRSALPAVKPTGAMRLRFSVQVNAREPNERGSGLTPNGRPVYNAPLTWPVVEFNGRKDR